MHLGFKPGQTTTQQRSSIKTLFRALFLRHFVVNRCSQLILQLLFVVSRCCTLDLPEIPSGICFSVYPILSNLTSLTKYEKSLKFLRFYSHNSSRNRLFSYVFEADLISSHDVVPSCSRVVSLYFCSKLIHFMRLGWRWKDVYCLGLRQRTGRDWLQQRKLYCDLLFEGFLLCDRTRKSLVYIVAFIALLQL